MSSSSEFDEVFDMKFSSPLLKVSKKKPSSSPGVSGMPIMFASMFERLDRIEFKVERQDPKLILLDESSTTMRAISDRIDSRLDQ